MQMGMARVPWLGGGGWIRIFVQSICLVLSLGVQLSQSQGVNTITSDGSLGTQVIQNGSVYEIRDGSRPGNGPNLFHSFGRFDVGAGDTAHFIGQAGVNTIIGRVTGGEVSMIDGELRSDATLFLLNPQGLVFGPGATLNIDGSFHASTADVLHFADGAELSTELSTQPRLTVAAPSAFGFLSGNPSSIRVRGSELAVREGNALSLVGGDMTITGDGDLSSGTSSLLAPRGVINLTSVGSSGEVSFDPMGESLAFDADAFNQLGEIELIEGARINASGTGAGVAVIRGGVLRVDRAAIVADSLGGGPSAAIGLNIVVSGNVTLTNGALMTAHVVGAADAGDIRLKADDVQLKAGSQVISITGGEGQAADLLIEASTLTVTEGSQISSLTIGPGQGGNVTTITAGDIGVTGTNATGTSNSGIFAETFSVESNAGAAGSVVVQAANITVADGAVISSTTHGVGQGGSVTVQAAGAITLEGTAANGTRSAIGASAQGMGSQAGSAGTVAVDATDITITDSAMVSSSTLGAGQGGNIAVTTSTLRLERDGNIQAQTIGDGDAGDIVVEAEQIVLQAGGSISSASGFVDPTGNNTSVGSGAAGNVLLTATDIDILEGSGINSSTAGSGQGGNITVSAGGDVRLAGANAAGNSSSGIFAETSGVEGDAGEAGSVVVQAANIMVADGAAISSTTRGAGKGGVVTVQATGTITLEGGRTTPAGTFASGIGANAQGRGRLAGAAGTVTVKAADITITDGAAISSTTFGVGQGGNVTVMATGDIALSGIAPNRAPSGIVANAQAGAAGTVTVKAADITITDGATISSTTFGVGQGGNVTVKATGSIRLQGDALNGVRGGIAAESRGTGPQSGEAGMVTVSAADITIADAATISVLTVSNSGGQVTVTTSTLQLEGGGNIQAQTIGDGNAGDIMVKAEQVTLLTGGNISSASGFIDFVGENTSIGKGSAGNITVTASEINIAAGAITASTFGDGDAGDIMVTADQVTLRAFGSINSVSGSTIINPGTFDIVQSIRGAGAAGNITVQTGTVEIDESLVQASTIGDGRAGNVNVTAEQVRLLRGGSIFSISGFSASIIGSATLCVHHLSNW